MPSSAFTFNCMIMTRYFLFAFEVNATFLLKEHLKLTKTPTFGQSGFGKANNDTASWSRVYHQSRNCKKNMPTDKPVDRKSETAEKDFTAKVSNSSLNLVERTNNDIQTC